MHRLIAPATAALLLLAAPAAEARTTTCARTATVVGGTVVMPGYDDPAEPGGHATRNSAKDRRVSRLSWMGEYTVPPGKAAIVAVQGVRYRLSDEAHFRYGCFGHSRAQGALYPRIALDRGTVVATTTAGRPGAVSTGMGMADPFADAAMSFQVKVTMAGEMPAVAMRRTAGEGKVNVTPYVGPRSGTCRQVGTARFVMTENGPRAYYDGRRARR